MAANGGDLLARVRRLLRPDAQAVSWKAALPVLALAAAGLGVYVNAAARAPSIDSLIVDRPPMMNFRSCAKPVYPADDLAAGHTGTVTVGLYVDADGQVFDSEIVRSSGHPNLDRTARDALALCKFAPGQSHGRPVDAWARIQYQWVLK